MTSSFAISEATRRTLVLETTHYVVQSRVDSDSYFVTTYIPRGYTSVAKLEFEKAR